MLLFGTNVKELTVKYVVVERDRKVELVRFQTHQGLSCHSNVWAGHIT